MEQEIRFCELDGRRIAYASIGEGPLLVFAGRWISHLEVEWEEPRFRAFLEELARSYRVVRYDRLGVGLSDRTLPEPPSVESEARALDMVLRACGGDRPSSSRARAPACRRRSSPTRPDRIGKLVFFGGYAAGTTFPRRRGAHSSTSSGRTGRSLRRCWPACSRRTAAGTRSTGSAGTSGSPPTPRWPPRSSSST